MKKLLLLSLIFGTLFTQTFKEKVRYLIDEKNIIKYKVEKLIFLTFVKKGKTNYSWMTFGDIAKLKQMKFKIDNEEIEKWYDSVIYYSRDGKISKVGYFEINQDILSGNVTSVSQGTVPQVISSTNGEIKEEKESSKTGVIIFVIMIILFFILMACYMLWD